MPKQNIANISHAEHIFPPKVTTIYSNAFMWVLIETNRFLCCHFSIANVHASILWMAHKLNYQKWIHTRLVCACEFLLNLSHTFSHLVLAIIFISIKLRTMHFASFGKSNHKLKRMAHQESAIDRNRRIIRSISITTVMLARILVIRNVG